MTATVLLQDAAAWLTAHVALTALLAAVVLAAGRLAWKGARKAARAHQGRADDALTLAVAAVATAVAVSGMWRFFAVVLHLGGPERAMFCAVLELAAFTEAVRAKRNMADHGSAGVDGSAMWALAALSGVLAAWSAGSLAAAVFRFSMPMVAAWLWHRGLALERRRTAGRVIHWRLTAERVLVRLGVADPTEREASDVAAARRITMLAHSAKRLRVLRASGARGWRIRQAGRRLDRAMTRAVEFADLAGSPARQDALLAQLGALNGAEALAVLDVAPPWDAVPGVYPEENTPPTGDVTLDRLLAWLTSGSNGVPGVPEGLNGHTHAAAEMFAADIAAGRVPGIRAIRSGLRVGQDRAQQVRAYLRSLARTP